MMNKGSILIIVLLILLIYVSCKNETKFNKIGWNDKTDPVFPSANREIMLNDLIKNYSLKNLSYGQLINLVGKPDYIENGVITYSINVNFGHDIDPG